jgi:endoglucanase
MFGKSLTLVSLLAAKAAATIWYAGVAESGGEFAVWSMYRRVQLQTFTDFPGPDASPVGLPGRLGVEYAFISKPAIDIYVDQNKVNWQSKSLH